MNIKGRLALSSAVAAITVPIYPVHSIVTLGINWLYHVIYSQGKIMKMVKLAVLPAIASLAWIIPYLIHRANFEQYFAQNFPLSYVFLPSLVLGIGIPLLLAAYGFFRVFEMHKWSLARKILVLFAMLLARF